MKIFRNLFTDGFKTSTLFFITGVLVSMLVTSVGISSSIAMQQKLNTRYELAAGQQYQLAINPNGKITGFVWEKLYNTFSQDEGLYLNGINIPVSEWNNGIPRVYPEIFNGKSGIFPLLKGSYFTYDNVKNKDKVALVGKELELLLPEINGKKFVTMSGTKYEVIGVIGYKNRKSVWDGAVYFSISSFPENEQSNLSEPQILMTVYSKSGSVEKLLDRLKSLFLETGIELIKVQKVVPNRMSFWKAISPRNFDNFVIYIFFIVSLINSLNIALNWISKRSFEIGIRKAFGHSNHHIFTMIFREMLLIFSAGASLATFIHWIIFKSLQHFTGMLQVFSYETILVSLVLVFVSTLLTTIYTSMKILSIQPVEALKC